jgi:hypothetical protein
MVQNDHRQTFNRLIGSNKTRLNTKLSIKLGTENEIEIAVIATHIFKGI